MQEMIETPEGLLPFARREGSKRITAVGRRGMTYLSVDGKIWLRQQARSTDEDFIAIKWTKGRWLATTASGAQFVGYGGCWFPKDKPH